MKRQKKKYSQPRRPFDKARITEENLIRERYGLKNKKEIWKADASIGRVRNQAKKLITAEEGEKELFVERLNKKGFNVDSIATALSLDKEDWLKRRLQTILYVRKLANTANQSRQLIVHKHVSIGTQIVNIPSYQVSLEEEPLVQLNITLKTAEKKKSKEEEIKEKVLEGGDGEDGGKNNKDSREIKVEEKKEIIESSSKDNEVEKSSVEESDKVVNDELVKDKVIEEKSQGLGDIDNKGEENNDVAEVNGEGKNKNG